MLDRTRAFQAAYGVASPAAVTCGWEMFQGGQTPLPIEPLVGVMAHPIYRVLRFDIVRPYTIRVAFDDGTEQIIDFQGVLAGELFGPLRDLNVFNQVSLDQEVHTLVWPNVNARDGHASARRSGPARPAR